ncbi:MAG: GtrA family protein [Bacteroidota bacterium]
MSKAKELLKLKSKFLVTAVIATAIDIGLYLLLYHQLAWSEVAAQSVAYPIAVLCKFFLEKYFVFESNRKAGQTFALAMLVSGIGYLLSLGLVYLLSQNTFLAAHQLLLKIVEKGLLFFYNFYFKRFAFEKRFV